MNTEVRVGIIAGFAQVIAALVALVGVLVSADDESQAGGGTSAARTTTSAGPTVPCTDIVERYRALVLLDPSLLNALVAPGADETSPVEADPEARRCGISEATLRAMQ